MSDESANISAKTWARTIESINKVGYMDGAADGQKATFQSSFDVGYKQGFEFGLELGVNNAYVRVQKQMNTLLEEPQDPRKINCQICFDGSTAQENIVNLYNKQKEMNDNYLLHFDHGGIEKR